MIHTKFLAKTPLYSCDCCSDGIPPACPEELSGMDCACGGQWFLTTGRGWAYSDVRQRWFYMDLMALTDHNTSDPYGEGELTAKLKGHLGDSVCPFPKNTDAASDWYDGFFEALDDIQEGAD